MSDILQLAIAGAAISLFVQFVKKQAGVESWVSQVLVIALSMLMAIAYFFLGGTHLWEAFLQTVGFANTIYLFVIRQIES